MYFLPCLPMISPHGIPNGTCSHNGNEDSPMNQLTPQDAIFLSMETPELPGHIGGLAFLAPTEGYEFTYATFVEFVRTRLGSVDRFAWRLQEVPFGLDRPYWVACEDFDPADHVHSIRIPSPYSDEALAKLVGRIFERPMDRSRPLWDIVLIEGLPGGRYAMLWRMHHCLMDGASGANVSEQLFDISPDASRESLAEIEDAATAGEPAAILALRPANTLSNTAGANTMMVGDAQNASPWHVPVLSLTPVGVSVCGEPYARRAPIESSCISTTISMMCASGRYARYVSCAFDAGLTP